MYTVYVLPHALQEIKRLPGHIRQRVKRIIDDLATNPQPCFRGPPPNDPCHRPWDDPGFSVTLTAPGA